MLHEHWHGNGGVEGRSINAYDGARGCWHQTWMDSTGGMLLLEGGLVDGAMVLEGRAPSGEDPTVVDRQRITWTQGPTDGAEVRQLWESSSRRRRDVDGGVRRAVPAALTARQRRAGGEQGDRMTAQPPEGADDVGLIEGDSTSSAYTKKGKLKAAAYDVEMERLQEQLVLLQYWIQTQGLKVLVIFEGRGSAGKGGVIKRITERTSPAHGPGGRPAEADRAAAHAVVLPAVRRAPAGRRRDGPVRPVLVQPLERRVGDGLLLAGGAPGVPAVVPGVRADAGAVGDQGDQVLVLGVSFEEQRKRFEERNAEPLKRWKLSDMDLAEHELYVKYSMAKDTTFQYTDIKQAPWFVVPSDDKRAARLNCINHLLGEFDYVDVAPDVVELPVMKEMAYVRPPMHEQTFVPRLF